MAFPIIARLSFQMAPHCGGTLSTTRSYLRRAARRLANALPSGEKALALTTCGGFYYFPWPEDFTWSNNFSPTPADLRALEASAEHQLWQLLTPSLLMELAAVTDFFSFGADSWLAHPSTTREAKYRCELVGLLNLKTLQVHWTGKYYPTGNYQMRHLYRYSIIDSHFVFLNRRRTMLLGCHDLNLFSPRGMASEAEGGVRAKLRAEFLDCASAFAPTIVLHHPHTTDSPRIWLGAIHQLQHQLPSVSRFISGINVYNDGNPPRGQWGDILKSTTFGPSVIEVKLA
ncbi:hypothetical protein [Hymenobacter cellulosivorans]|uniref:Uncharacterized protein n=1 Tax=Hymenobacter cellulosivorans TaxID=2932249 RepID=A0ABY4F3P3_9BACT|nr:hypothetical protein [Hymenobacter cellulosivorans]UOQ50688.1 hypothetical protein MUN80_13050 [Hymenobacter cellulosivorans]